MVGLRSIARRRWRRSRPSRRTTPWTVPGGGAERHRGNRMGSRCPLCRGAKSRVSDFTNCRKARIAPPSNIDYERNFSRKIELPSIPNLRSVRCLAGNSSSARAVRGSQITGQGGGAVDKTFDPVPLRAHTVFEPSRPARKWITKFVPTASSRRSWRAAATSCLKGRTAGMNSRSARKATGRSSSSSRTTTWPGPR